MVAYIIPTNVFMQTVWHKADSESLFFPLLQAKQCPLETTTFILKSIQRNHCLITHT